MHRRTLTLRRFGPMSFGLGYFEDGTWVDHSIPDATTGRAPVDGNAFRSGRVALDVVHEWYTCCVEPAASGETDIPPPGPHATDRSGVVARSGRPGASVVAMMTTPSVRAVEK